MSRAKWISLLVCFSSLSPLLKPATAQTRLAEIINTTVIFSVPEGNFSQIIGRVSARERYVVLDSNSNMLQIQYSPQAVGWIYRNFARDAIRALSSTEYKAYGERFHLSQPIRRVTQLYKTPGGDLDGRHIVVLPDFMAANATLDLTLEVDSADYQNAVLASLSGQQPRWDLRFPRRNARLTRWQDWPRGAWAYALDSAGVALFGKKAHLLVKTPPPYEFLLRLSIESPARLEGLNKAIMLVKPADLDAASTESILKDSIYNHIALELGVTKQAILQSKLGVTLVNLDSVRDNTRLPLKAVFSWEGARQETQIKLSSAPEVESKGTALGFWLIGILILLLGVGLFFTLQEIKKLRRDLKSLRHEPPPPTPPEPSAKPTSPPEAELSAMPQPTEFSAHQHEFLKKSFEQLAQGLTDHKTLLENSRQALQEELSKLGEKIDLREPHGEKIPAEDWITPLKEEFKEEFKTVLKTVQETKTNVDQQSHRQQALDGLITDLRSNMENVLQKVQDNHAVLLAEVAKNLANQQQFEAQARATVQELKENLVQQWQAIRGENDAVMEQLVERTKGEISVQLSRAQGVYDQLTQRFEAHLRETKASHEAATKEISSLAQKSQELEGEAYKTLQDFRRQFDQKWGSLQEESRNTLGKFSKIVEQTVEDFSRNMERFQEARSELMQKVDLDLKQSLENRELFIQEIAKILGENQNLAQQIVSRLDKHGQSAREQLQGFQRESDGALTRFANDSATQIQNALKGYSDLTQTLRDHLASSFESLEKELESARKDRGLLHKQLSSLSDEKQKLEQSLNAREIELSEVTGRLQSKELEANNYKNQFDKAAEQVLEVTKEIIIVTGYNDDKNAKKLSALIQLGEAILSFYSQAQALTSKLRTSDRVSNPLRVAFLDAYAELPQVSTSFIENIKILLELQRLAGFGVIMSRTFRKKFKIGDNEKSISFNQIERLLDAWVDNNFVLELSSGAFVFANRLSVLKDRVDLSEFDNNWYANACRNILDLTDELKKSLTNLPMPYHAVNLELLKPYQSQFASFSDIIGNVPKSKYYPHKPVPEPQTIGDITQWAFLDSQNHLVGGQKAIVKVIDVKA